MLESELFGYEEGAFTGAKKGGKIGLFELAHTGTIFLDEIGDTPFTIQTKLLRLLQEKEIMRIAGNKIIPIDVRVISATNKNLNALIEKGTFRSDLYYRLNVFHLHIPPLRDRKEDIDILMNYFLAKYAKKQKLPIPEIDTEIRKLLLDYQWPGNIRELEHITEYIVTIAPVSHNFKSDIINIISPYSPSPPAKLRDPNSDTSNYVSSVYLDLRDKVDIIMILKILRDYKANTTLIGRSKLISILRDNSFILSEQQVKTRLAVLKKHHLIKSIVGKGSVLTKEGEAFLDSL